MKIYDILQAFIHNGNIKTVVCVGDAIISSRAGVNQASAKQSKLTFGDTMPAPLVKD